MSVTSFDRAHTAAQSRKPTMTREEYGQAYQSGFRMTVHFLISRGILGEAAGEAAQAAWVRGWERLEQLRNSKMVITWVNSIALNIHRSHLRRPAFESLQDVSISFQKDLASVDLARILTKCCSFEERTLLQQQYLDELKISEIARRQGCSETAARIRILRARRAVHERLCRSRPRTAKAA